MHKSHFLHKLQKLFFEEVEQNIIQMYLLEAHAINLSHWKLSTTVLLSSRESKKILNQTTAFRAQAANFTTTAFINFIKFSLCTRNREKCNWSNDSFKFYFLIAFLINENICSLWNDQWTLALVRVSSSTFKFVRSDCSLP